MTKNLRYINADILIYPLHRCTPSSDRLVVKIGKISSKIVLTWRFTMDDSVEQFDFHLTDLNFRINFIPHN